METLWVGLITHGKLSQRYFRLRLLRVSHSDLHRDIDEHDRLASLQK